MGIYIKGMEMPTTCGKCKIKNAIKCNRWELVRSVLLDRHRDCPLVPVPPHGRLIDVDAPMRLEIQIDGKMNRCVTDIYAPTVIEAEGGGSE